MAFLKLFKPLHVYINVVFGYSIYINEYPNAFH